MSNSKGFTLIELLVVITILAVLSGIVIAILNPFSQINKANDARRKSDLSQIQKAFEQYYQDNGRYPSANGSYQILRLDGSAITREIPTFVPYINVVPMDPDEDKNYIYVTNIPGQAYYLYASLDKGGADPQACFADGSKCTNAPADATCGEVSDICNYGVTSPNVSP